MAIRKVDHFFPTYADAVQAVADLTAAGIPSDSISMIESETDARLPPAVTTVTAQNPAGTGATFGAAIGAGLGALDGVGAVTIPLIDPLADAGWIVTTLTLAGVGAPVGLIVGLVVRGFVRNDAAHSTAARLQRGEHLVMVSVDDALAPRAAETMARRSAMLSGKREVDPAYSYEAVADDQTPEQEVAEINRDERTLEYKSE